jgi:hypothetical protein
MGDFIALLRITCVILFTLSIPVIVRTRFRNHQMSASRLLLYATALGWIFPFAHKMLEHPMHQAWDREQVAAAEEHMRHPPPPINGVVGHSETVVVDNPYGIGDWITEEYHPVASLLYGPAYLAVCWIAAWVFVHRTRFEARSRILLVSGSLLLTFWIAVVGYEISPPTIFSDGVFIRGWNHFFGPQLSLPLAVFAGWLLAEWLPVYLDRTHKDRLQSRK